MKIRKKYVPENCDDLFEEEPQQFYDDREVCGCRQKTITAGKIRECEVFPIYRSRTALSRAKKAMATSEKQKKQNAKTPARKSFGF